MMTPAWSECGPARPVSLLAVAYAAAEGTAPMEFTTPEAL
jgi:hypothetical protein